MKKIKVVSLFDGISCGQIALQRAGVKIDNYFASEIDNYAIQITQKNYPNTIQLGNVEDWENWDIDWASIDLIIGGSPCQGFSFAGRQLNFNDERSKLFFYFADILNFIKTKNPNIKFLLENVQMKQEFKSVITEYLNVEPIEINSALVSAQNRQRVYWTNIKDVTLPSDKGILIEDIIDHNLIFNKPYNVYKFRETKNYIQFDVSGKGYNSQQDRAFYIDGKFGTFPNARAITKRKITDKSGYYRDLTLNECEALQNLPKDYTKIECFSLNKSLSAIGNGWTVDVIADILKGLE